MIIELDPEVEAAFKSSAQVSSKLGPPVYSISFKIFLLFTLSFRLPWYFSLPYEKERKKKKNQRASGG